MTTVDVLIVQIVNRSNIAWDYTECPANTTHLPNVGPMLDQRRRRWANIGPTLGRCVVFAGWATLFQFPAGGKYSIMYRGVSVYIGPLFQSTHHRSDLHNIDYEIHY